MASGADSEYSTKEKLVSLEPQISKIKELLPPERVTRKQYRKAKKKAIRKINRASVASSEPQEKLTLEDLKKQDEIIADYKKRKALWEERENIFIQRIEKRRLQENVLKSNLEKSLGICSLGSSNNLGSISLAPENSKKHTSKACVIKNVTEELVPSLLKGKEPCIMFKKTGSCRLGPACLWQHIDVSSPTSILIFPHMFQFAKLDYGTTPSESSASLQKPQETTITTALLSVFYDFFYDILPELSSFGSPIDIKVSHNSAPHLRGNVYVVYTSPTIAKKVHDYLYGRFYDRRTLLPRYIALDHLRPALCDSQKCPRGFMCNYLHTFITPVFKRAIDPTINYNIRGKKTVHISNSSSASSKDSHRIVKKRSDSFNGTCSPNKRLSKEHKY